MSSYAEYEMSYRFEVAKDCANFGLLVCGVCRWCMAAKDQSRREAGVMRDIDACRDAFEDWYSGGWEHPQAVERDGDGYKMLATDNAWQVWRAAWEYPRG